MNLNKLFAITLSAVLLAGCVAQAPRGDLEVELAQKTFTLPAEGQVHLYIYRSQEGFLNSDVTSKKKIWVNGRELGSLIAHSYLFTTVPEGVISIETQSEFGNNELVFEAFGGKNYFVEQRLKVGVVVSGSELNRSYEQKGKQAILGAKLLKSL